MQRKNQIIWVILFILVSGVILSATSYAYIGHRAIQEEKNTANTSCFQVEFEESEGILLENASPLSEAEAYDTIKPYKFKITNTCVNYTDYQINLESLMLDAKVLSDQYLDVTLVNYDTLETHYITSLEDTTTPVLSDAKNAYILKSGRLGPKESVEYGLWVWLEYNTPVVDEVMNATWKGKITIQTTFSEQRAIPNLLKSVEVVDDGVTLHNLTLSKNDTYELSAIEFESELKPHENATEVINLSEYQVEQVLGYYVLNEDNTTYTLYIQADGKIRLNPDSSHFFQGTFTEVRGMKNVDTSYVTNMTSMFEYSSVINIDLQYMDTSNVTSMLNTFHGSYFTELDLSNWKTDNVTDMYYMFAEMYDLTNLNIEGWNTQNVTDMESMFMWNSNLTTIKYGNSFIKNKNATITNMFYDCPANKPSHSSWEGVSFN